MKPEQEENTLTLAEVANALGISQQEIRTKYHPRELRIHRFCGCLERVTASDFCTFCISRARQSFKMEKQLDKMQQALNVLQLNIAVLEKKA